MKVGNPRAKHVPLVNFKLKVGNPFAIHVVLGNTTSRLGNQVVNRVVQASTIRTTIKLDNLLNPVPVKIAAPASTTTKQDYSLAKPAAPANTIPTTSK